MRLILSNYTKEFELSLIYDLELVTEQNLKLYTDYYVCRKVCEIKS